MKGPGVEAFTVFANAKSNIPVGGITGIISGS